MFQSFTQKPIEFINNKRLNQCIDRLMIGTVHGIAKISKYSI